MLWHSAYIRLARALWRRLQTSLLLIWIQLLILSQTAISKALLGFWSAKVCDWLPPTGEDWRRIANLPAPPNCGSDVRDSGRRTCKAVLLVGHAVPGVGNRQVGTFVMGRWGKQMLSSPFSCYPCGLSAALLIFRKETLRYVRQKLPTSSNPCWSSVYLRIIAKWHRWIGSDFHCNCSAGGWLCSDTAYIQIACASI